MGRAKITYRNQTGRGRIEGRARSTERYTPKEVRFEGKQSTGRRGVIENCQIPGITGIEVIVGNK